MKVMGRCEYHGYDINRKPVIDRKHSGAFLLGVYSGLEVNSLVVVKMFEDKKWEVLEEFIDESLDMETCLKESTRMIFDYEINYIFGNEDTPMICVKENFYNPKSGGLIRHEIINLDVEKMFKWIKSTIKNIKFESSIRPRWNEEILTFSMDKISPRIFALSPVLARAEWQYSMFQSDVPDILVDANGVQIIEEVTNYRRLQRHPW